MSDSGSGEPTSGTYLVEIQLLTGEEEDWDMASDYAAWLQSVYDDPTIGSPTGNFQIVSVRPADKAQQEKWWTEIWHHPPTKERAMNIFDYLREVSANLAYSGNVNFLRIEQTNQWLPDGTTTGGTRLVDRAIGELADIEITLANGSTNIVDVTPKANVPYGVAKILIETLHSTIG